MTDKHFLLRSGRPSALVVSAFIVALLAGLPVASVGFNLFLGGTTETWAHLASTVLPDYVLNSLALCAGVGLGVAIVGVATAWLTAEGDTPRSRAARVKLLRSATARNAGNCASEAASSMKSGFRAPSRFTSFTTQWYRRTVAP